MRNTLSQFLIELVNSNNNTYVLTGDHGHTLFANLRKEYPEHFINAGVAEQNMVGIAAGMAKMGLLPIVYGLGAFVPIRVLEQIKLDICYENLKVIILGDGAGAVYTEYGVSHQTFEDIACLRSIPNIKIFSPCDRYELTWSLNQALENNGPSYIRIGKSDQGVVFNETTNVSSTGLSELIIGHKNKPAILATGSMVSVAKKLLLTKNELNGFSLFSVAQIKPLNFQHSPFLNQHTSSLITIEEHNQIGGLGSAVCEAVSSTNPRKVLRIGANDRFTKNCGSYKYAMIEHGLDAEQIFKTIQGMEF